MAVNDDNQVLPPPNAEHVMGVSHFIPTPEFMLESHLSFRDYKTSGCSLFGGVIPEGIDVKQDRPLKRNLKRKPTDMGRHFSVFPTRSMPREEFVEKLASMRVEAKCVIGGCEHTPTFEKPTPDYPADALLRHVSVALFEMATNGMVDPNKRFRALYFHYLLAEEDAGYCWILRGDALSYYSAHALEICTPSASMDVEEVRDEIRSDLAGIILYSPTYRSYPDDTDQDEPAPVVLFGECMLDPEDDDDDYGVIDETTSDIGDSVLSTAVPTTCIAHTHADRQLHAPVSEVTQLLFHIIQCGLMLQFVSAINDLPAGSGVENIPRIQASKCSLHCWTPAEVALINFCRTLPAGSQFGLVVHSLTVHIQGVPRERGAAFVNALESNPVLSNAFLAAVACVKGCSLASTHFLGARQPESYRIVEHRGFGKCVCVSIFDTDSLSATYSAHVCTAVNKCIKCFKRNVWFLKRRVIVMCISQSHSIDLCKVHPGDTSSDESRRSKLQDQLQASLRVLPDKFVFGPVPGMHKFLVFSYGKELHNLASETASNCFKKLQVKVNVKSELIVEF